MDNPFIKILDDNIPYVNQQCSINSMVIKELPDCEINDDIKGKMVKEIFSAKAIIDCVRANEKRLEINSNIQAKNLPIVLEEKMRGSGESQKCAMEIAMKFGNRLGVILLTLKQGKAENRIAHPSWNSEHWDYWKKIENVILVGGLANGYLGEKIIEQAKNLFEAAGEKPYNIVRFENASHVGAMGCSKLIKSKNGLHIVLDLGQTGIKRAIVKMNNGEIGDTVNLETLPSRYMDIEISDEKEKKEQALALHKYIVGIIAETYSSALKLGEVGSEIIISIANYTVKGKLNTQMGGYSKLGLLDPNYAECLSEDVSGRLKREMSVKLIHDGTAVALYFSGYKNAVCMTMGTFFGIGFPQSDF